MLLKLICSNTWGS